MSSYRRPRRSRIYDANFNMGYNAYKPALDSIDRKYATPLRWVKSPLIFNDLARKEIVILKENKRHSRLSDD